jgi:hypothetical protein
MRSEATPCPNIAWRISSFCASGECVEVAKHGDAIMLRSSLARHKVVRLTPAEWQAFVEGVRAGEFGDLAEVQPDS